MKTFLVKYSVDRGPELSVKNITDIFFSSSADEKVVAQEYKESWTKNNKKNYPFNIFNIQIFPQKNYE